MNKFKLKSKVWVYPGMSAWRFLTVPKTEAIKIKRTFGDLARGFGSLPVIVEIGNSKWETSIFPDKKSSSYLLPLKAIIRKKENISDGDNVTFNLEIQI